MKPSLWDRLTITFRDWRRGFTNEDLAAALRKTEAQEEPGGIVWLSDAEFKAWIAFSKHRALRAVRV